MCQSSIVYDDYLPATLLPSLLSKTKTYFSEVMFFKIILACTCRLFECLLGFLIGKKKRKEEKNNTGRAERGNR